MTIQRFCFGDGSMKDSLGEAMLYADHLAALAEKEVIIKVFQDDTIMRKAHIAHLEGQIAALTAEPIRPRKTLVNALIGCRNIPIPIS